TTGIGCKAYLFQQGKLQYQELMLTRGFESSSDARLHFGLGSATAIDSVLIVWPDQKFQLLRNVPVNKQLTVLQKEASGTFNYNLFFKPVTPLLTQVNDINVDWSHRENNF